MAREYVQERLSNWARWASQRATGGLGYPSTNPLSRMMGERATSDTAVIPVHSIDAQEVDAAVSTLRAASSVLWLTLMCRYLGDPDVSAHRMRPLSQMEIAARMSCTDRTVRNRLAEAELMVQATLSDRR